jgi:23S rRNA (pseudouridine1915-N3)-methyltransferase
MEVQLVSVGDRVPAWVQAGYGDYAKRLPRGFRLTLREVAPAKRAKTGHVAQWREQEGERILAALTPTDHVVALDLGGRRFITKQLADAIRRWLAAGDRVSLLCGGPGGLSAPCLARAREAWCLSPLTFPHPLVRVIVAEQLYRAWSLLQNHPYHRA